MAENRNNSRRQRRPKAKQVDLQQLVKKRFTRPEQDFKPDPNTATWAKTTRLTQLQQLRLLKWFLYIFTCIACLVVQDVILSQLPLFGACTDLPVCAMLLITVLEGTEVGSIFLFLASLFYFFSGSAPIPMCISLLTCIGVLATVFRQMYWHRSKGSILMCTMIALSIYEMSLFVTGLVQELTVFSRIGSFVLTSIYSCLALIPLYSLIYKIGLIGGNTWKE
jgi:hypothetical protein